MKSLIVTKLDSMCSNSSGSIHAAVNKLLAQGMIECNPSGRKKIYTITAQGRQCFLDWVHQPMQPGKQKDMELSKLFFGGFIPPRERAALLEQYITSLESQYAVYKNYMDQSYLGQEDRKKACSVLFDGSLNNMNGVCSMTNEYPPDRLFSDLYQYQILTLKHALDNIQFEIDWYTALLKEMQNEE